MCNDIRSDQGVQSSSSCPIETLERIADGFSPELA
jgi:hypothetical protein